MRVLIACEFSGVVRDAFLRRGHDAMSCDLLPTESPGPHYEGDVRDVIDDGWDLMVAHPECRFFANSGVRHLYSIPSTSGKLPDIHGTERWKMLEEAAEFFRFLLDADIPRIAVENPTPHRYAIDLIGGRKYDQAIQPWMFGHGETKRTCLWLKNLPPLFATMVVDGREARIHRMSPGKNRWKLRSITYQGIADAMADQWGELDA